MWMTDLGKCNDGVDVKMTFYGQGVWSCIRWAEWSGSCPSSLYILGRESLPVFSCLNDVCLRIMEHERLFLFVLILMNWMIS
jgi:hypothetical protein